MEMAMVLSAEFADLKAELKTAEYRIEVLERELAVLKAASSWNERYSEQALQERINERMAEEGQC
jgi:hypothetical protein